MPASIVRTGLAASDSCARQQKVGLVDREANRIAGAMQTRAEVARRLDDLRSARSTSRRG